LGLGGNLGDRESFLRRCRDLLERSAIRILRGSSVYETEPIGPRQQPWFLNQVVEVETELGPQELLDAVKSIEAEMGRVPGPAGGPRVIDIDILLAGDRTLDTGRLQVPHPRLAQRNFVLVPLSEIAPEAVHPGLGKTIRELRAECRDTAVYSLFR
jgi:2-amino-4-hydroxy-6-hydroxymethyldihydropteridine diphosphokinase